MRQRENNFVAPRPEPRTRVEIIEVERELPAPPQTILMPNAGSEDRSRGFVVATLPLAAVGGLVVELVAIIGWQVPIASLVMLLLALAGFAAVWLISYALYVFVSPDGGLFLHTVFMWGYLRREQRERHRRYASLRDKNGVAMNSTGVIATVTREKGIAQAAPVRHNALRAAAEKLSRRNVDQSRCELMNEALARLMLLAYEQDADGFCNVDGATGKLLIPLPLGRLGHAKWGLRQIEAVSLRQVLFDWQYPSPTLFFYDKSRRAWFVNLRHFEEAKAAHRWLTQHQIGVATYRAARVKRIG